MSTPVPAPAGGFEVRDTKVWKPTYARPTAAAAAASVAALDVAAGANHEKDTLGSLAFGRVGRLGLGDLEAQLGEAAAALRAGEVVAFPTETVYGLGGDATRDDAIARIYRAKGRPSDNPLIVHIASREQLADLVQFVPPAAARLMDRFWPGPLSFVLRHTNKLSRKVTAGLPTVALRMPQHPVALALIRAAGLPIAAPSANASGRPSPTLARHVLEDIGGRIAGVVDGTHIRTGMSEVGRVDHAAGGAEGVEVKGAGDGEGEGEGEDAECVFGVESTVLDMSHLAPDQDVLPHGSEAGAGAGQPLAYILRPGAVTKRMLEAVLGGAGTVMFDPSLPISAEQEAAKAQQLKPAPAPPAGPAPAVPAAAAASAAPVEAPALAKSASRVADEAAAAALAQSRNAWAAPHAGYQPMAPGMKYTHYAPRAPLFLAMGSPAHILRVAEAEARAGRGVGLMATRETLAAVRALRAAAAPAASPAPRLPLEVECGSSADLNTVAVRLYDCLRRFDAADDVDVIIAESVPAGTDDLAAVCHRWVSLLCLTGLALPCALSSPCAHLPPPLPPPPALFALPR